MKTKLLELIVEDVIEKYLLWDEEDGCLYSAIEEELTTKLLDMFVVDGYITIVQCNHLNNPDDNGTVHVDIVVVNQENVNEINRYHAWLHDEGSSFEELRL